MPTISMLGIEENGYGDESGKQEIRKPKGAAVTKSPQ